MAQYKDIDEILNNLPDDLPYKASVKRVLIQAPTADVVPKSEVEKLEAEVERLTAILNSYALQYGTVADKQKVIDKVKAEVAREIFEEIREVITLVGYFDWEDLCELKREYTEGK